MPSRTVPLLPCNQVNISDIRFLVESQSTCTKEAMRNVVREVERLEAEERATILEDDRRPTSWQPPKYHFTLIRSVMPAGARAHTSALVTERVSARSQVPARRALEPRLSQLWSLSRPTPDSLYTLCRLGDPRGCGLVWPSEGS